LINNSKNLKKKSNILKNYKFKENLMWKPSKYGGANSFRIPYTSIW